MDAQGFTNMKKSILPIIFIFFWFCLSLYFGTGGYNYINILNNSAKSESNKDTVHVTYQKLSFSNKAALNKYLEEKANSNLYPILDLLPTSLLILITVFSFGILGSITHLIKQVVIVNTNVEELKYISEPILGMLTGFIIIGLTYLVPSTLTTNDVELKPMSLMFLSFFSGYFSTKFYLYLNKVFEKIFK